MIKDDFDVLIATEAESQGVPFTWIKAVIGTESDFDPTAYRPERAIGDGSFGLMQILGGTARRLGYTGDFAALYDPAINIALGTKLLAQLRASYGTDFSRVYSAYNSGGPDNYKTNNDVAAHVNRAKSYLALVEQSVTTVIAPDDTASGGVGFDVLALLAVGAAVVYWFFIKR